MGKTTVSYKLKTHDDLDGVMCGVLAKKAFGERVEIQYCSNGNINKSIQKFLVNPKNKNIFLFITDISVDEENEMKLTERSKNNGNVQLIDHHKTSLHLNQHQWGSVKTHYEDGKPTCATSLFYDYLVKNNILKKDLLLDTMVELVRQYDTWDWEKNQNFTAKQLNDLFFIVGIPKFEESMLEKINGKLSFPFTETETMLLEMEEQKIQRYIQSKEKQMIETSIFEYCIGVVHGEQYHSELGNVLAKNNPHLDFIVIINVGGKKISYRTIRDDIDLSKIASHFEGGGHPKASGSPLNHKALDCFVLNIFDEKPKRPEPELNKYNIKGSKYGVFYENHQNDIAEIYSIQNETLKWGIRINNEKLEVEFNTFEEAERNIYRNYRAWLCRDDILIEQFSMRYDVKETTLRSQFQKTMETIFN